MTWDIFCHVIDNWGDLGVCWRLSADLARRGQQVRLWVDDPQPLTWMAPGALEGQVSGVTVHPWPRTDADAMPPAVPPGDVLVEAFGCEIAPTWVQQLLPPREGPQPVWLNLEYLSAEPWVERCHRLPSPVLSGPLAGRTKWYFYPGFTTQTGGLLREPGLLPSGPEVTEVGMSATAEARPTITLFCYEPKPLAALLAHPDLAHAHWQVAGGRSAAAYAHVASQRPATASVRMLPLTDQPGFDRILWSSDLNLVRGEDSLVRALWAGQAFVWHIYPQHDNAHHAKLEAFLDWLQAPGDLRQMHRCWNGVDDSPLPALTPVVLARWRANTLAARQRLQTQDDLTTQLLGFVAEKR